MGRVDGVPVVAFCTDARIRAARWARGLRAHRARQRRRRPRAGAGDRPVALRRRPARRRRRVAGRRRPGVRRHDQGLGRGAADLRGPRAGRRRRRLRPGADRHRDHGRRRPHLRHRPRRRPQRHRRAESTWPRSAAPSRTASAAASCTSSPRPRPTPCCGPAGWPCCSATRAGSRTDGIDEVDFSGAAAGARAPRLRRAAAGQRPARRAGRRAARQVGAEHRHHARAGSAAGPSA